MKATRSAASALPIAAVTPSITVARQRSSLVEQRMPYIGVSPRWSEGVLSGAARRSCRHRSSNDLAYKASDRPKRMKGALRQTALNVDRPVIGPGDTSTLSAFDGGERRTGWLGRCRSPTAGARPQPEIPALESHQLVGRPEYSR